MPAPRFYLDLPLALGARADLPEAVARHALGALRLKDGDAVTLFNGDGAEYHGVLAVRGKAAWAECRTREAPERESPLRVALAQGVSAGERMDYTVQKAVELGVAGITPVLMRRSVVRLDAQRAEKRRRHWQGVAAAACEQCGRNRVPEVAAAQPFIAWLGGLGGGPGLRLLLDPEGGRALAEFAPPAGPVLLLAGPEGGFDPEEKRLARAAGFQPLRLGPRVLRTETAALAALAALQTLWGDF